MAQEEILAYLNKYPKQWFTERDLRDRFRKSMRLHHQLGMLFRFNMIQKLETNPIQWRAKDARR